MSTELHDTPMSGGTPKKKGFKLRAATLPKAVTTTDELVLHIDDDPSFCRLASFKLRNRGFEVASLSDPLKVMDEVERLAPAVVLLDICMDGRSGLQILRDLQLFDRGIQVVMMTGLVAEKTLIDARSMGAAGCLFKPVADWERLFNLVDGAMERNRSWRSVLKHAQENCPPVPAKSRRAIAGPKGPSKRPMV